MTANKLKVIALITMIIDHSANFFYITHPNLALILRSIGRISFPIFAFLLAESIYYTSDKIKLFKRLLLFAFISEIPFDIYFYYNKTLPLFSQIPSFFADQNIFFTLALGTLCVIIFEGHKTRSTVKNAFYILLFIPTTIFIHSDYGLMGIYSIFLLYLAKKYLTKYVPNCGIFVIFFMLYIMYHSYSDQIFFFSLISVPILILYNGKKGNSLKYLYYAFYPVHLAIFAILKIIFYNHFFLQ